MNYNKFSADLFSRFTCFKVQSLGALSGRQRRNLQPCRNLPPAKWSNCTSATNLVSSGCHSIECLVLQRLSPPGALPVKPGGWINASSFLVRAGRSSLEMEELKPT